MMKNFKIKINKGKVEFLFLLFFILFFLPNLVRAGGCYPQCYGDSGTGCGSGLSATNECNMGVSACCACGWFYNVWAGGDIGILCKDNNRSLCGGTDNDWEKSGMFPNTGSTTLYNGNMCYVMGTGGWLDCFVNMPNGDGYWDASENKCVTCTTSSIGTGFKESKSCGDKTSLSLGCAKAGDGLCESACGGDTADEVCDEKPDVDSVAVTGGECRHCTFFEVGLCGNGNIDSGEECDIGNFNGKTCQSFGYTGGALACDANCYFDKSGCTAIVVGPSLCPCSGGTCSKEKKGGLVPCGRSCDDPDTSENECCACSLCHIFIMLDRIVDFILIKVVPPLAILMLAIGGIMFLASSGNPGLLIKGKSILGAAILGIVIIYSAWVIVNFILVMLGVASWVWPSGGWFTINCPLIQ